VGLEGLEVARGLGDGEVDEAGGAGLKVGPAALELHDRDRTSGKPAVVAAEPGLQTLDGGVVPDDHQNVHAVVGLADQFQQVIGSRVIEVVA
jgi:hypothetical protein